MTTEVGEDAQRTAAAAGLPAAEALHVCFCRSRETTKRLRLLAFLMELAVVAITGWRIVNTSAPDVLPLVILAVTVAEVVSRHFVGRLRDYAQQCRRLSMRAYAKGEDVEAARAGDLQARLPALAYALTPKFTCPTLVQYYDFTDVAAGDSRLRAICAYSAFFSSRLLRRWTAVLLLALLLIVSGGIVVLYYMAMSLAATEHTRHVYLDALLTVAWWYAAIRVLEGTIEAWHRAGRCEAVFQFLLRIKARGADLEELVEEYDYVRASGGDVPTLLYSSADKGLEAKWASVRPAFLR